MRVTDNYIMNRLSRSIQNIGNKSAILSDKVSSGKKISKGSEDPTVAMKSLKVRRDISRTEQYKANLENAQSWFEECESLVYGIRKLADDARIAVLEGSSGTYSETDRKGIAETLRKAQEQILAIGNTMFGGKYILGGPNAKDIPFTSVNGKLYYNGKDMETLSTADIDNVYMDMGMGLTLNGKDVMPQSAMVISLSGEQIMGIGVDTATGYSNNLYNLLGQLAEKFENNDLTNLTVGQQKLSQMCDQLTVQMVSVGEKSEFVEFMANRYDSDLFNSEKRQSQIEDVDFTSAVIKAKTAELAYNATLQMGAKVIQPSLIDYLK